MAVFWTEGASAERARLFSELVEKNPPAAIAQDDAIERLAGSLDGLAKYATLPNGARWVPVGRYPVVIIYDLEPGGDALVLALAPTRTNWKPA